MHSRGQGSPASCQQQPAPGNRYPGLDHRAGSRRRPDHRQGNARTTLRGEFLVKEPLHTVFASDHPRPHVALVTLNAQFAHSSLALRQLRQWAVAQGYPAHQLTLHEWTINDQPSQLLQRLYELDADLYAFSCSIWNRRLTERLSDELAQVRPGATILWGGPEASQDATAILLGHPAVSAILAGEGEQPFAAFLAAFSSPGFDPETISGLVFRDEEGQVRHNPPPPLLSAQEWLFPYTDHELCQLKDRLLYFETSRGCPYGCTYCLSSLDKTVRLASLEWVEAAFSRLIAADLRQVKLVDRTFNIQPARARAIWHFLIERHRQQPFRTNFHFEIMADRLDPDDLELLATAPPGLIQFEIGVQTTTPAVLEAIHRPCDWPRLQDTVLQLRHQAAIHLHLDLIAGLPSETPQQFARSFNDVFLLQPHDLQLGFLKVLPGSPMAHQAVSLGFKWSQEPPYEILASDAMTFGDLAQLKDIETVLDLYFNSGKYAVSLPWLAGHFPGCSLSPYAFFQALAAAYRSAGWFDLKTSPVSRARFLLDFGLAHLAPAEQVVFLSRLKLDYLLQGAKDQPEFLDTLENRTGEDSRQLLKSVREQVRDLYPRLNRFRSEQYVLDKPVPLPAVKSMYKTRIPENSLAQILPAGNCVAAFDLQGPQPVLIYAQKLD
ncbi:MAG: DUF4080 domain-containing protein [Clostridia bacterium]|nr:DUF4080 domain-containing protein [Clostridia bacterium]